MRILALDLGKYKTVARRYEAETGRHRFATMLTTPKALHDLIVDRGPQRVVIEICSIAGGVGDLVRSLGIELQNDLLSGGVAKEASPAEKGLRLPQK
jgi:hypothetical protein